MLLLGIDIGTSASKVSVIDAHTQKTVYSAKYPDVEAVINSPQSGWAEQSPESWWSYVQQAISLCHNSKTYDPKDIKAIGIAYQMHGLVIVDKDQKLLRDSIIWCDSRAVEIGEKAFTRIGEKKCLGHLLNSPGNFTASKLAWVKENEPETYRKIDKVMLPGDYIAMKLTGDVTTTVSALSEGVFYDFIDDKLSDDIINYFGFDKSFFADIRPVFSVHGYVQQSVAQQLGLSAGIPVSYKAGDQPNNALSLNVLKPGEVAATAGTSGVIYGVTDKLSVDSKSRVNTFAHVNYLPTQKHLGVLLCINGTGSMYRWARDNFGADLSYVQMNQMENEAPAGSAGLNVLPFGNGAERMLENRSLGAQLQNIDFNIHNKSHIFRATQEGIACSFRYGLDIMRENQMLPSIIKAGQNNLFLSDLFTQTFVDITGVPVELYANDGSVGAALGAGIGAAIFNSPSQAFENMNPLKMVEPTKTGNMEQIYTEWKALLHKQLVKE